MRPQTPSRHSALFALCLLTAMVGCDREPDVVTYLAPVDPKPPLLAVNTMPEPPAPSRLGAPADPAQTRLAWTLPPGWSDTGESNEFRVATLVTGGEDDRVSVAVSAVPGQAGTMTDNVNRWRRQIGLPPVDTQGIMALVVPASNAELGGFLADLVNDTSTPPQRMRIAWFEFTDSSWYFKATGSPSAIEAHAEGFNALIASVREAEAKPAASATDTPLATYTPPGWSEQANPAAPRMLAFDLPDGGELTLTRFPGSVGTPLANVNRWRQQIGLPPLADVSEQESIGYPAGAEPNEQIPIYRITDDTAGDEAPFVLALPIADLESTWFIKLTATRALRVEHAEQFVRVVDGLRLPLKLPDSAPPSPEDHAGHNHD